MTFLIFIYGLCSFIIGMILFVIECNRHTKTKRDYNDLLESYNAQAKVVSILSGAAKLYHLKKIEVGEINANLAERTN